MPGPCSLPEGDRRLWQNHNEIVCNLHKDCTPDFPVGKDATHEWVTLRVWLSNRNRLRTGKTCAGR